MADVRADVRGPAKTDLGVHVRAVHIDLAAVGMDDFANFLDGFLKHAVGGGICDHQAGKILLVRPGLGAEIGHDQCCLPGRRQRQPLSFPP